MNTVVDLNDEPSGEVVEASSAGATHVLWVKSLYPKTPHQSRKCLDIQQILDVGHIALGDHRRLPDTAAALGIFAHENMAMECATTLDFTSAGNFKAFFRSAIGLDFWHDYLRKK